MVGSVFNTLINLISVAWLFGMVILYLLVVVPKARQYSEREKELATYILGWLVVAIWPIFLVTYLWKKRA